MYLKHPTPYYGIAGFIENRRIKTVKKLSGIKTRDKILEIGCERGVLLRSLPDCKLKVGLDISYRALADAKKYFQDNVNNDKVKLILGDATKVLPFKRGEFDVIVCSEMLEHVSSPRNVLENIHQICDENTRVVITVPVEPLKLFFKKIASSLKINKILFPYIEEKQSE